MIHHVAPLTDHSRVDPLCLWVVGRRGSPLRRYRGGVLELVAKVLHDMASYVVNGFALMPEMLDRLHNLRPLVRDARPLFSAYLEMLSRYRLNTEIRQKGS